MKYMYVVVGTSLKCKNKDKNESMRRTVAIEEVLYG